MNVSKEGIDINRRFFQSLEMLRQRKRIRGVQTVTNAMGITRISMTRCRLNPEATAVRPEWIAFVTKEYGVSLQWVMLGEGEVFA